MIYNELGSNFVINLKHTLIQGTYKWQLQVYPI